MKTYMASPATIERKWYVVDATGYTLGRLASEVAKVLRGKNKPEYTPHINNGNVLYASHHLAAQRSVVISRLIDVCRFLGLFHQFKIGFPTLF